MLGEGRGREVVGIRRPATGRRDEGDDGRTRGRPPKQRICHAESSIVPHEEVHMSGSQSQVWVAYHDGHTLIRADAIMAIGQEDGQVTARLAGPDGLEVLLADGTGDDMPIPDDFHCQLIRAVAEAAYSRRRPADPRVP